MQELELTKHTVDQLAAKVDEAKKTLDASEEYVQYFDEKLEKQCVQVLDKDAEAANDRESPWKLDCQVMSLSANLKQAFVLSKTDKSLFEGLKTALALQKMEF